MLEGRIEGVGEAGVSTRLLSEIISQFASFERLGEPDALEHRGVSCSTKFFHLFRSSVPFSFSLYLFGTKQPTSPTTTSALKRGRPSKRSALMHEISSKHEHVAQNSACRGPESPELGALAPAALHAERVFGNGTEVAMRGASCFTKTSGRGLGVLVLRYRSSERRWCGRSRRGAARRNASVAGKAVGLRAPCVRPGASRRARSRSGPAQLASQRIPSGPRAARCRPTKDCGRNSSNENATMRAIRDGECAFSNATFLSSFLWPCGCGDVDWAEG